MLHDYMVCYHVVHAECIGSSFPPLPWPGRKISQYYYVVHIVMRSLDSIHLRHVRAAPKGETGDVFCYVSITLGSWNAAIASPLSAYPAKRVC